MQLEYKKIEQIANNVQDILNNESKIKAIPAASSGVF